MALNTLNDILNKKGESFLNKLFTLNVIIYEKFSGSTFSFEKINDKLYFYRKDNSSPLTKIDRTINKYYEEPINYIMSLSHSILSKLPENHRFNFEYFPNKLPNHIQYDKLPKNKLILMSIVKYDNSGKKLDTITLSDTINYYSNLFKVSPCPILFNGTLSDTQIEHIKQYIKMNKETVMNMFQTTSFTKYIISLLNPTLDTTFLQNSLDKNIEGVVFLFHDKVGKQKIYAKLIDPVIEEIINKNKSDIFKNDIINIINANIIEFIYTGHILQKKYKFISDDPEERYIELISILFNDFIKLYGNKYENLDLKLPKHINKNEFDLNDVMIKNEITFSLVNTSKNYREIFKLFLMLFKRKRKNIDDFLSSSLLTFQNELVDMIFELINYQPNSDVQTYTEFIDDDIEDIKLEEQGPTSHEHMKIYSFWQKMFDVKSEQKYKRTKNVNLVVGNFQPFHKGHLQSCLDLYEKTETPIILVQINNKNTKNKPISYENSQKMFSLLIDEYSDMFEAFIITKKCELSEILDNLDGYNPKNIVSNSKYQNYFKSHYNYELFEDKYNINSIIFEELRHNNKDLEYIKSNKILEYILNDNIIDFKKSIPECLHNLYEIFRADIKQKIH